MGGAVGKICQKRRVKFNEWKDLDERKGMNIKDQNYETKEENEATEECKEKG